MLDTVKPDTPDRRDAQAPSVDHRAIVLLLLAVAGCVDGVGLAELGRFFVSAMSGNTTSIGLALSYQDWTGALVPLGLVALFVAGVTIGALVDEQAGRRAAPLLLFLEAIILASAWAAYRGPRPMVGTILLPVAMGLANLAVVRVAGIRPGATYVTGTLVRIGIGLADLGRRGDARALLADIALWAAMLIGAFAGGWGRLRYGSDVLLGPVAALILIAIASLFRRR